jgi:hypothetical protein
MPLVASLRTLIEQARIVLSGPVRAGPVAVIPTTLPLLAAGLGALGLLGWRRKRKNAAAIAAA